MPPTWYRLAFLSSVDGVLVFEERKAAEPDQDGVECDRSRRNPLLAVDIATTEVFGALPVISLFRFVSRPIADLSADS